MSETCDKCKHFSDTYFGNPNGFGNCERWHIGYSIPPDMKDNECMVEGDEGWGMIVGPKFGCVLFEAKD